MENFQFNVDCTVDILPNQSIKISAQIISGNSANNYSNNIAGEFANNYSTNFKDISCDIVTDIIIPEIAKKCTYYRRKITQQFNKTKNTIF